MSDATLCHCCLENGDSTVGEHRCTSCRKPTCESCLEEMTQWNAGWGLRCASCVQFDDEANYNQSQKDLAKLESFRRRAAKAAATRRTPESIAKREAKMAEKRERIAAEHRRIDEAALQRIEEFMGHFKYLKERR